MKNIWWFLTDPVQYPEIKTMQSNLVFPRQHRNDRARRGLCMNNALKSTFITSNVYNYHISQNLTINGVVMDGNWTDFSELYFLCAFLWLVFLVIDILTAVKQIELNRGDLNPWQMNRYTVVWLSCKCYRKKLCYQCILLLPSAFTVQQL